MGLLIRFILFCFDPFELYRKFFFRPMISMGTEVLGRLTRKTKKGVTTVRDLSFRLGVVSLTVALIIWSAIFLYIVFYYVYMPPISHTRPVHMQFKPCADSNAPCSFPHAHISLTKRQQLLMVGQAYKILVNIDMPESPQNQQLGMFMVCAEMRDLDLLLRGHSCRSAIMRYKSPLIQTLTTWGLSPLYVLGLKEEFQRVPVEIFPQYVEERQHPITDIYVEIQSHKIQFYTVTLHITADFTGLRYMMFNWPILSAAIGVSTNLMFILVVFLLSWYHWSESEWIRSAKTKFHQRRLKNSKSSGKNNSKSIKETEEDYDDDEDEDDDDDDDFNGSMLEDIDDNNDVVPNSKNDEEPTEPIVRKRKAAVKCADDTF